MIKAVENQQLSLFYNLLKIQSWISILEYVRLFRSDNTFRIRFLYHLPGGLTSFSRGLNPL